MPRTSTSDDTGFKQDMQQLGDGIGALKGDVNSLAHGAVDAARSGVAELRQGAQHAVEVAKDKFIEAKDGAADAAESLKAVISRNPVASVGVAAGVGMLVALILFRPRS